MQYKFNDLIYLTFCDDSVLTMSGRKRNGYLCKAEWVCSLISVIFRNVGAVLHVESYVEKRDSLLCISDELELNVFIQMVSI